MYDRDVSVRNKLLGLFGVCCLVLLISTSGQQAFAAEPQQYGGTLKVGLEMEPRGFDPLQAFIPSLSRNYIMAIEERLFEADMDGKLIPQLGLSATASEDGKTWTVILRQGVKFHDGTAFNADAVVSHWQRMLNPENRYRGRGAIATIVAVEKQDEFSVRFQLKHPWAEFTAQLASHGAIGSYLPSPKAIAKKTQNRTPIGTGPFMFKEWLSGDRVVVVKNPNYWRKGLPYLDKVVFLFMPDMQTRFSSLQSGEVDIILTDRGLSILEAQKDPALRVYDSLSTGAGTFVFNTSKPPLDDLRVRQALAHAWNQAQYLKTTYQGTMPLVRDPFGTMFSCGDVAYREYNPQLARELIKDYGQPVEFEYLHSSTPRGRVAGAIVQQLFKDIGVSVKPVPITLGQMIQRVLRGNYQMAGWGLPDTLAIGTALSLRLHSKSRLNVTRYQNEQLDKLLQTQKLSINPEEREAALCEVATILNQQVPQLYRGGNHWYLIGKQQVQGIKDARHGVIDVQNVWLEQGAKEK